MKTLKPNKINFAERFGDITEKKERKARNRRASVPVLLSAMAVAAATLYYAGSALFVLKPRLLEITQYINSEESQSAYSSYVAMDIERQILISRRDNLKMSLENIGTFPEMDNNAYAVISQRAGESVNIETMSYKRETGNITVGCTANHAIDASDYVARLRSSGFFSSVDYYGYDGDAYGGVYLYKFSVILVIPPEGGGAA